MTSHDHVLAVVIGRAGSKGLPGKNAMPLLGRPMISYTIEDALNAEMISRIVVSTDGGTIARAAEAMGIEVIHRPAKLATDTATVDEAARHAVESVAGDWPIVVILYANVPVRPDDLLDRAVTRLIETGADSVQSYTGVGKHHPYWMVALDDAGRVKPHHPNRVYRRQDLPDLLIPDGGVIAVTRASLFHVVKDQPHAFLGEDRRGITTPAGSVVDVDDAIDFTLAEMLLKREGMEVSG